MAVPTTQTSPIVLDDAPPTVAEVVAIAHGARVALGPVARARIEASRAVVDALAAGEELIYGLNTQLGHGRDERLGEDEIRAGQHMVVRMHAGGVGPPLAREIVRAAVAVRIAGFARGGSGVTPSIADAYVAMLNAGVHPVVPLIGSVGASDLMHMAAIALVALGEGSAELDGDVVDGATALARAGIAPVQLGPKDGLTLISANGVAIGHAALVVDRAARLADAADVVGAVSLEAVSGNPSVLEPAVAAAKPVPGQAIAAARIRELLRGSELCTPGAATSVQDPLSFRVAPQVHGAFREVLDAARRAVDQELAAADDNPYVSVDDGRMISNGNFHPMLLALTIDAVRPALAHVGQLSDRRAGQLWDRLVQDPEVFRPESAAQLLRWGTPLVRYAGAARTAELRGLAAPASLDVMPLDLGVEDHATMAPLAVRRTDEALGLAEEVLAVELLTASTRVGWRTETREKMAPRTRAVLDGLASVIADVGPTAPPSAVHAAAVQFLRSIPEGPV